MNFELNASRFSRVVSDVECMVAQGFGWDTVEPRLLERYEWLSDSDWEDLREIFR